MSDRTTKMYYSNVDEEIDSQTILRQKNDRMIRNTIGVLFLSILVVAVALGWSFPPQIKDETLQPTGEVLNDIDTSHDPIQADYTGEPIKRKISGDEFTIIPVASYEISAVLVSMKPYSELLGFAEDRLYAKISQIDLCLAWGQLAEPEYDRYMTYSQGKRYCSAQSGKDAPLDFNSQINHWSNNHIIPATENVHNAIKSLKNKEKVVLKGSLVNVQFESNGQEYMFLKSSLSRTDSGYDACEVFYVNSVRIGNKIYE